MTFCEKFFFVLTVVSLGISARSVQASEFFGSLSTGLNTSLSGVVMAPSFAVPAAGVYSVAQNAVLSAPGSQSIHYTVDGGAPACSSGAVYNSAIAVVSSLTIKAVACYANGEASSAVSFSYVIQPPPAPPPAAIAPGGAAPAPPSSGGGGSFAPPAPAVNAALPSFNTTPAASQGQILGETFIHAHPNGTLVLDGKTVFLIKDGKKFGFRNPDEYKSYGFNFSQAVAASAADNALPDAGAGAVNKALEGTLVLDAFDNKTVYMIGVGGTKRGFVSADIFKALGYTFGNLPKINLSDYPSGPAIASSSSPHPEGALVRQSNGTVWWILGSKKQGFESMSVFNTYGFPASRLVKANAADLALSEGALVRFRDGTLVKDGNSYYLISDGKKLMFASSVDTAAKGYKTQNAISASLSKYESGGMVP